MPSVRLKSFVQPFVEFIFPPTCFICETLMDGHGSPVCASCWAGIRHVGSDDRLRREMQHRLTESSHVADLISLYHFEMNGTLQSMIHQLKYEGMTRLGEELGRKLGEKLQNERIDGLIDGIVPVPLHPAKLRERGYNQSESIARGIRDVVDLPVHASLLRRHKHTSSQTKLGAEERKKNVGDAFSVNERYRPGIEDRTFLIVDDVITTGATVAACAEVLATRGAKRAVVCSVALADHSALP